MILDITGETLWSDTPAVTLAAAAGGATKLIIQPVQFASAGVIGSSLVTSLSTVPSIANTTATADLGFVVTNDIVPIAGTKAHVSIREAATNMPIIDINEQKVYAVAYNNGLDAVELKFFSNDPITGVAAPYAFALATNIEAILPSRTDLATANEEFPMVNAGWADEVGAFEIGNRIWVDGLLNDGTTATYGFIDNEDITTTINKIAAIGINDKNLGDTVSVVSGINSAAYVTTFLTNNANSYLADGDTLIAAIEKLDAQAKVNSDAAASASADKVLEILTANVAGETAVTLPQARTYLNTDKDAMDVFVNGQALVSDAVASANVAGDLGDYAETSTTQVTFHFPLESGDVIIYTISKAY